MSDLAGFREIQQKELGAQRRPFVPPGGIDFDNLLFQLRQLKEQMQGAGGPVNTGPPAQVTPPAPQISMTDIYTPPAIPPGQFQERQVSVGGISQGPNIEGLTQEAQELGIQMEGPGATRGFLPGIGPVMWDGSRWVSESNNLLPVSRMLGGR